VKWFCILTAVVFLLSCSCPLCPPGVPVAETADIAVINGEDAGTTPWEFDSISAETGCVFELDVAAALHGSSGYKHVNTGNNEYAYGTKAITEQTEFYIRFYLQLNDVITQYGGSQPIFIALTDGGVTKFHFGAITNGSTKAAESWRYNRNGIYLSDATNFSENVPHYVDMYFKAGSGANGVFTLWVDSTEIESITGQDYSAIAIDGIKVGQVNASVTVDSGSVYIDDILLSTTGPIGPYPGAVLLDEQLRRMGLIDPALFALTDK